MAIALYAVFSLIILSRAGAEWTGPAGWIIAISLSLGVFGNVASRSKPERLVMTPIAAVLAACAAYVAFS